MSTTALVAAGATSVAIAAVGTVLATSLLRRRSVLDVPNDRSSHRVAVPRGGGAAVALATVAGTAVAAGRLAALPAAALAVAGIGSGAVGLADDLTGGLAVAIRLAGLAVVAGAAGALVGAVAPWSPVVSALGGVVALVWIAGFTNATNFMDGIDGLIAGQAVVAGAALSLAGAHVHDGTVEVGGVVVAAAALGFAPSNFPRARVFLGDVGSYFVGSWLAVLAALAVTSTVSPVTALAPLAVIGADAGLTLARRLARHEPVHLPHRQHAYQRLVDGGWSHPAATGTATATSAACAALGWVALGAPVATQVGVAIGVAAIAACYLALPALVLRGARPGIVPGNQGVAR